MTLAGLTAACGTGVNGIAAARAAAEPAQAGTISESGRSLLYPLA